MLTAWGTAAALAAQRATTTVPVIAIGVGDPVAAGLVNSLGETGWEHNWIFHARSHARSQTLGADQGVQSNDKTRCCSVGP
jgi:hypothetical protein